MTEALTLYELNSLVRGVLEEAMDREYWVVGEFSEARTGSGGHLYAELVQRDASGNGLLARARVNCWARQFSMLRLRFARETGEEIRAGLEVMALVRVTFHEQYGYALHLLDLDPNYTLGDVARRRREILERLASDGILHDNQELTLPTPLRRIAVVSSATAAGYGDFCDQLLGNEYALPFHIRLFPAVMQGRHVPESILAALDTICQESELWDVVVIIRGGGATSDLSDFDSYELAAAIAQFPLPVIVGIGHERDETVLDHVAHTRVKTPTAAATLIVEHQLQALALLEEMQRRLSQAARQRLHNEHLRFERLATTLPSAFAHVREREDHRLAMLWQRISVRPVAIVERHRHRVDLLEQRLASFNPERLLALGYSMTLHRGRVVRDPRTLQPGDEIETRLERGTIHSQVTSIEK